MRLRTTTWTAPLALLALVAAGACRDGSAPDVAARESLQRDLELAQASAVTLAPSARDRSPTRFVSALEGGAQPSRGPDRAARPARRSPTRSPMMSHTAHATPAVATVAAAPNPVVEEAQMVAAAPAASVPAAESAPLSREGESAAPYDPGIASTQPGSGPYGDDGPVITRRGRSGGIGGVVIRGGGIGDDDHCERDHPGSRMPFPMGTTIGRIGGAVMGAGVGRGTFGRRF